MRVVVKAGGRALLGNLTGIAESIARRSSSHRIVFVHGGGDVVSEYSRRMGIEPKFVTSPQGIRSRYTDLQELEVYVMVMAGKLNKEIVAALRKLGVKAVGISGADGGLLTAERKKRIVVVDDRGRKRVIEGGYTGMITSVSPQLLELLTSSGFTVVVAPIAVSEEGELLNVDGDQAATSIAKAISADALVLLSDVDGVLVDGEVVGRLTPQEAFDLSQRIGPGMNRKLMLAGEAVSFGVKLAIISNGLVEDPLKVLEEPKGTLVAPQ
ncbi:MAG: [LysW]-aminoadipate/[LysW]-glutamate kinase [Thaumarchaeota archaeon]|nr:[LysW]-aminoadipate/[LysW]-glutamate kinase [Candidatus Calditenuaceae archaeon]MCX8203930.1 [LysW]-aminoadipate/[LysW]-glutamate kinase [Nitrososphaeria archaeon]MDW8043023.1 [LysW]-aminoadipate/[LysW]-glutamate kinase [Nitrososphaerota archaeon]